MVGADDVVDCARNHEVDFVDGLACLVELRSAGEATHSGVLDSVVQLDVAQDRENRELQALFTEHWDTDLQLFQSIKLLVEF